MYLPSRLQKYAGIGREVSAVIGLALSKGSSERLTQTLRVPLRGLMKAMNFPSGEICAPEISGSPKNNSRSMIGGRPFGCAKMGAANRMTAAIATTNWSSRRTSVNLDFMLQKPLSRMCWSLVRQTTAYLRRRGAKSFGGNLLEKNIQHWIAAKLASRASINSST